MRTSTQCTLHHILLKTTIKTYLHCVQVKNKGSTTLKHHFHFTIKMHLDFLTSFNFWFSILRWNRSVDPLQVWLMLHGPVPERSVMSVLAKPGLWVSVSWNFLQARTFLEAHLSGSTLSILFLCIRCAPGFYGKTCTEVIDACYGNPCVNGANCQVLEAGRFLWVDS